MYPITKAQPKEMVPVVHKPVIQYVVEEAYQAGIREILIITGKDKYAIENHFSSEENRGTNRFSEALEDLLGDINIYYIRQKRLNGLGDAVGYAEAFAGDDPFALLLGDTITIPPCIKEVVSVHERCGASVLAVEQVPRQKVSSYGIIDGQRVDEQVLRVCDLVEKPTPESAPSDLAILGTYILTAGIFPYIRATAPGVNGEIQLTDALKSLIRSESLFAYQYRGRRFDIGNKLDWLKANIELSLEDEELGENIREFIGSMIHERS